MSVFSFAPQSVDAPPRRFSRSLLGYALVEALTWLFLIGMVGTVSAGQSGSSSFTLAVAAAGIAVSFIRRGGAQRLTFFAALVELLTLFLVVGVASNPLRNGLSSVMIALAAWVAIEGFRAWLWQPTTVLGALGQVAILIGIGLVIDGRTAQPLSLSAALVTWVAVDLAWSLVVRALATRQPFNARLTRRQVTLVTLAGTALLVALVASAVVNYTTVQYQGQTVSMESIRDRWTSLYCITYPWKVAGLNLSQVGFAGTTECFDTEAELRQAAAAREWVGRRGFSDERP